MNKRPEQFGKLIRKLLLHRIRWIKTPQHVADGYAILCFDRDDKPLATVLLHKLFHAKPGCYFEVSIIDEAGNSQEPCWQTAQEAVDTILSAM